jgi:hypothetical protein
MCFGMDIAIESALQDVWLKQIFEIEFDLAIKFH